MSTIGIWPGYSWTVDVPEGSTLLVTVGSTTEEVTIPSGAWRGLCTPYTGVFPLPPASSLHDALRAAVASHTEVTSPSPVTFDDEGGPYLVARMTLMAASPITIKDGTFPCSVFGFSSGVQLPAGGLMPLRVAAPWAGAWFVQAATSVEHDAVSDQSVSESTFQPDAVTQVAYASRVDSLDEHLLVPERMLTRAAAATPAVAAAAGVAADLTSGTLEELFVRYADTAPRETRPGDGAAWLWRHENLADLEGTPIRLLIAGPLSTREVAASTGVARRYNVRLPWRART